MDELRFQLELASFDEKIGLAKLEEVKAAERVKELEYQKVRFQMEWINAIARAREQEQLKAAQAQPQGK